MSEEESLWIQSRIHLRALRYYRNWLGIPTVMGADIQPSVLHRRTLIVDGYRGELLVDPEPVLLQEYQRLISEEIELSRLAEDDVNLPAQLKSGERIKVMLNAGRVGWFSRQIRKIKAEA